jgi:hypothetical protein
MPVSPAGTPAPQGSGLLQEIIAAGQEGRPQQLGGRRPAPPLRGPQGLPGSAAGGSPRAGNSGVAAGQRRSEARRRADGSAGEGQAFDQEADRPIHFAAGICRRAGANQPRSTCRRCRSPGWSCIRSSGAPGLGGLELLAADGALEGGERSGLGTLALLGEEETTSSRFSLILKNWEA